jgi:hypothetical protein
MASHRAGGQAVRRPYLRGGGLVTDGTGFDAFEQEFADFNQRVTALRAAREDSPDVLDAVFLAGCCAAGDPAGCASRRLARGPAASHGDRADRLRGR